MRTTQQLGRVALLVAVVFAAANVRAGPSRRRRALWHHALVGVGQLVDGHLASAVRSLAAARRARPTPLLDVLVGLAAISGGRRRDALRQLERAIGAKTTEPLAFYWAARVELSLGHRARALQRMHQALAIGPRRPAVLVGYAVVAGAAGRREAARRAMVGLARIHANLLDPRLLPTPAMSAVSLLEPLLSGFEPRQQLWRTQGHLQWKLGKALPALERFERVLRSRAHDGDALQMKARCLHALGQPKLALDVARRAVRDAPGAVERATYGELLLANGRAADALEHLRRAVDARSRDGRLLASLARACREANEAACARRFARYAVRRAPQLASAQRERALALSAAGKVKQASRAFDRAIEAAPLDERLLHSAAHQARLAGDLRRARRLARRAAAVAARRAPVERRLARYRRAHRAMGQALVRCRCLTGACRAPQRPACRRAAQRLHGPARVLLSMHLRLRAGATTVPRGARQLVRSLRPRLVAVRDPTRYIVRLRVGGRRLVVRKALPMLPPLHAPAADRAN